MLPSTTALLSTNSFATTTSISSYAIVPPQIDHSRPAHKQSDPTLYAGVVKERDDGIFHQAQIRYVTKLRFMVGLAQRTIEMIGSAGSPPGS